MKKNFTVYKNRNGNEGIVIDGFTFYAIKSRAGWFRCTVKSCNVCAQIVDAEFVEIKKNHVNHSQNALKTDQRRKLIESVKHLATTTCLNAPEIICNVIEAGKETSMKENMQSVKFLKRIVREQRKSNVLIQEKKFGIFADYFFTIDGHKFIQDLEMDEFGYKTIIILNDTNKQHIEHSNTWICDGTFFCSPKEFSQVYVIHADVLGVFFPIAYIFLNGKSYSVYFDAFKKLFTLLNQSVPKNFVMDFEYAPYKAISEIFKNTNIYFCNFHFGQAFFKNIQKKGLSRNYNHDSNFRNYMQMLLALAYEKVENVKEKFLILQAKIKAIYKTKETENFLHYFDITYIGTQKSAIYKIENWSTHNRILQNVPTTTNISEAWNKGINYSVRVAHPALNDFIQELRTRDYLSKIKCDNHFKNPQSAKINKVTEKIKLVVEKYESYYELTFLAAVVGIKNSKND